MTREQDVPAWLDELRLAYESGAHGQFVLYGNVADRFALDGRLVSLTRYLDARLLGTFDIVFLYDPGNGLSLLRGAERFAEWPAAAQVQPWPTEPRAAVELISRYLRYRANLRALGRGDNQHVAVILRGADLVLPASLQGDFATASLASLVRDWAAEPPFSDMAFASLLLADNLNDLHPLVANNPRIDRIQVPLPDVASLQQCLAQLQVEHPQAFVADDTGAAQALAGVSLSALASLVKRRAHEGKVLGTQDWTEAKKELVEADSSGLVEFIESARTLDDYHAQDALKTWLRQDMALWQAADLRALPKGYIFCGPVGTGKTYLVECLAGEAGVPVVKLKNFRDRWVGSSEGNLEKIFRLIRGLGRCIVFIDEADQALGKREGGGSDGGLSGRIYSMIAQEMGAADNRGKVIWILASSRPDLIEVDLKRPGRVDVKIPLLPTTTAEESAALLKAMLKRFDLKLERADLLKLDLPLLLTPGAAEALAVKVYRQVRTAKQSALAALKQCLLGYQPPVSAQVLRFQMAIAIREATDAAFVPESLRALGQEGVGP
ncbi:AAA family ATPase [Pseudomonas sp. BMS12]|uniref:AAA family ATPase n=1 Tax=Pseudomonas sp. BMS12 TaxID=1796033 RepID=UPI00083AF3E8|nr:ATP-binding protein [Pseudomonas sp. BMS12]